jgi:hypothetical protein
MKPEMMHRARCSAAVAVLEEFWTLCVTWWLHVADLFFSYTALHVPSPVSSSGSPIAAAGSPVASLMLKESQSFGQDGMTRANSNPEALPQRQLSGLVQKQDATQQLRSSLSELGEHSCNDQHHFSTLLPALMCHGVLEGARDHSTFKC